MLKKKWVRVSSSSDFPLQPRLLLLFFAFVKNHLIFPQRKEQCRQCTCYVGLDVTVCRSAASPPSSTSSELLSSFYAYAWKYAHRWFLFRKFFGMTALYRSCHKNRYDNCFMQHAKLNNELCLAITDPLLCIAPVQWLLLSSLGSFEELLFRNNFHLSHRPKLLQHRYAAYLCHM